MYNHLGYEKYSNQGNHSGNSRNDSYKKLTQTEMGGSVIKVPRDQEGNFESMIVPKHQSRGLSIERLVIFLYAKGMSVSDIESEMQEIYGINLSTSAISIITNKVSLSASEWQNRPLESLYMIVWMVPEHHTGMVAAGASAFISQEQTINIQGLNNTVYDANGMVGSYLFQ